MKVIGLSSFDRIPLVKQMIAKGASGYLLKNTEGNELHDAIVEVSKGQTYYQAGIKDSLLQHALGKKQQEDFIPKLTVREQQVLRMISEELTTNDIAKKLFISSKTVESHRQNLMLKLGARNSAGLIKNAIERGLL
jgi:DNA-binding NarL/FixJ family response regulator